LQNTHRTVIGAVALHLFLIRAVEIKESSSALNVFEYKSLTCHNPLFFIPSIGLKFPSQLEVAVQSEQQETVPIKLVS
jgi:hypothetical protein